MITMRMRVAALVMAGLMTAAVGGQGQFQTSTQRPGIPQSRDPGNAAPDDPSGVGRRMEEQREMARNAERQKKLVDDTNKLLQMATELKASVDKSNKDTLSIEVIKKATEIERLAHSVKERMKG